MTQVAIPKARSQEHKGGSRWPHGETRLALALLAPCLLILTFIIAYPLGRGLYLSTLNSSIIAPAGASTAESLSVACRAASTAKRLQRSASR